MALAAQPVTDPWDLPDPPGTRERGTALQVSALCNEQEQKPEYNTPEDMRAGVSKAHGYKQL